VGLPSLSELLRIDRDKVREIRPIREISVSTSIGHVAGDYLDAEVMGEKIDHGKGKGKGKDGVSSGRDVTKKTSALVS
jgi:hypothetical protein